MLGLLPLPLHTVTKQKQLGGGCPLRFAFPSAWASGLGTGSGDWIPNKPTSSSSLLPPRLPPTPCAILTTRKESLTGCQCAEASFEGYSLWFFFTCVLKGRRVHILPSSLDRSRAGCKLPSQDGRARPGAARPALASHTGLRPPFKRQAGF